MRGIRLEGQRPLVRHALHRWLDSWRSVGIIEHGMYWQGYDLHLERYADQGWRATFFSAGMAHSYTSSGATAWQRTPWRAAHGAALGGDETRGGSGKRSGEEQKEWAMARHKVTFRLSATAYETIKEEAVSRGDESTVLSESREALAAAAELTNDGVWVVGCAEEASWDIEDWFEKAAAVESAAPKGDAGRFEMLKGAVRAIRDGRAKSRREKK